DGRLGRSGGRPSPALGPVETPGREPRPRDLWLAGARALARASPRGVGATRVLRNGLPHALRPVLGHGEPGHGLGAPVRRQHAHVRRRAGRRARAARLAAPRRVAGGGRDMRPLRIAFLLPHYSRQSKSHMPVAMRMLSERGVVVDVIHPSDRVIHLSTLRVEHDLYVLKNTGGYALSLAGALHAQGAAI